MTRVILTSSSGVGIKRDGEDIADEVIPFTFRFVWGELPSADKRRTRIFNEWEHGYLLEGLAHGPAPAVSGLDDALRTIDRESYEGRLDAYHRSRLSLTEFGKAVVARQEDFSRHNPIDRWWGGTRLTNDNLWRWDPVLIAP
jgi:hypothetical protein